MMFDLTGKTALVTGSSRGIGAAIAQILRQHGAKVYTHGSLPREGIDVVQDLSLSDAAEQIYRQTGDVDILVLNASVQINEPWQEVSLAHFQQQMQVNVFSSMRLAALMTPAMKEKGWGRILGIGSVQEKKPRPHMLAYAASKGALSVFLRGLAEELAPHGVTVNDLAPGVIDTDRNKQALSDPIYAPRVMAMIPSGFAGTPEDCAAVALLLVSEEGRYITGQNLYVDGGKGL